jgi:hypothetical protein
VEFQVLLQVRVPVDLEVMEVTLDPIAVAVQAGAATELILLMEPAVLDLEQVELEGLDGTVLVVVLEEEVVFMQVQEAVVVIQEVEQEDGFMAGVVVAALIMQGLIKVIRVGFRPETDM